jgi:hypothetical protein
LMCQVRIFHSQRMQSKFVLDFLQEAGAWLTQANPYKRVVLRQDGVRLSKNAL